METLGNKIQQTSAFKYYCDICHYGTSRKCNYNTHIISLKHLKNSKSKSVAVTIAIMLSYKGKKEGVNIFTVLKKTSRTNGSTGFTKRTLEHTQVGRPIFYRE